MSLYNIALVLYAKEEEEYAFIDISIQAIFTDCTRIIVLVPPGKNYKIGIIETTGD